ncbi:hypothetical protein ATU3B_04380 [Agrobacterium genomosp. 3 str. CIP 111-78]|uniref:Uncharacterized protein n=1 Tax=Agrobacterium tumefaciens TaxID=358 RepID=A0AAE6BQ06_AGRTU|nr:MULTISPECIES: hypothetical protein [Agrobacterium tumefaciens complex]MCA2370853.1 hypothetical protein [Agrobacterium tomkonis CIP 111-78]QCM02605.1 hypothetical protein CFBP6624_20795 [Agrobacterium tumefaciens]
MPDDVREQTNTSDLVLHRTKVITILWLVGVIIIVLWCIAADKIPDKLNEWGDFAAGAFSPIAFVWFITAVIMQSYELRQQRLELKLTRREFELNRHVLEAQTKEAERQVDLLEVQTTALRSTFEKAQNDAAFDAGVDFVSSRLRQYPNAWAFGVWRKGTEIHTRGPFALTSNFYDDLTNSMVISKTARHLRGARRTYFNEYEQTILRPKYPHDLARIFDSVKDSTLRLAKLPEEYWLRLRIAELDDLYHYMASIEQYIEWPTEIEPFKLREGEVYGEWEKQAKGNLQNPAQNP